MQTNPANLSDAAVFHSLVNNASVKRSNAMMNFIQGESWTQELVLQVNDVPVVIGPADVTDTLCSAIEVLIKVNTRIQARYRYPYDDAYPKHELLEIDLHEPNMLRLKITRNQSRFFEAGYLTAFTTVYYREPEHRELEIVQIMGYLLKSDFAMRL